MPYVRSYYRRSQGAASVETPAGARLPTVAIYDAATGTDLLKTRAARVTAVSFSTGLPGGFLQCDFVVRASGARAFGIDTGQKVVVSRGLRVVWWGWVEDVQRVQRGRLIELAVSCLGPWQTLEQRLIDVDYDDWYPGDQAIRAMLASVGTYISSDYSQIDPSGVNMADLTKTDWKAADLVKLVCDAGTSSGQPLLFAIWEPGGKADIVSANNLIPNPQMELGPGTGVFPLDNWTLTGTFAWDTTIYKSAAHGCKITHGTGTTASQWSPGSTTKTSCAASTTYRLSFWVYFQTASQTATAKIYWYNAGASLLATYTASAIGSATGWVQGIFHATSPASTSQFQLEIVLGNTSGGDAYAVLDDVYLNLAGTSATSDALPRAKLWSRDLSDYDYVLWTSALASGLAITETTRDLVNAVKASYGSSSYTSLSEDGTSQTAYRRRDVVLTAGSDTGQTAAEAIRDAYLATYKDPRQEPATISLAKPGAIRTAQGSIVPLERVRAGDRLMIADGPLAGSVIMVASTRYANGALSITPEGATSASSLLARSITR